MFLSFALCGNVFAMVFAYFSYYFLYARRRWEVGWVGEESATVELGRRCDIKMGVTCCSAIGRNLFL